MLFVEKPRNNFGYRIYNVAVIEGDIDKAHILVSAPDAFKGTIVNINEWQEVSSKAGLPRIPTSRETSGDADHWRDEMIRKFSV